MVSKDNGVNTTESKPKPGLFKQMFGRRGELAGTALADHGAPVGDVGLAQDSAAAGKPEVPVPASPAIEKTAAGSPPAGQRPSWWARLRQGLSRTSSSIWEGFAAILSKRKLDAAMLEDLEDVLIRADLGVATAARISKAIGQGRYDKDVGVDEVKAVVAAEVERVLAPYARPLEIDPGKTPFVILVVGVNGSGK